jgi:hypothetical protein
MNCPRCGVWTELLETRTRANGEKARRYECGNEHRFTVIGDTISEPQHKSMFGRRGFPRIERDRANKSPED